MDFIRVFIVEIGANMRISLRFTTCDSIKRMCPFPRHHTILFGMLNRWPHFFSPVLMKWKFRFRNAKNEIVHISNYHKKKFQWSKLTDQNRNHSRLIQNPIISAISIGLVLLTKFLFEWSPSGLCLHYT